MFRDTTDFQYNSKMNSLMSTILDFITRVEVDCKIGRVIRLVNEVFGLIYVTTGKG